jgi:hypothetical protein
MAENVPNPTPGMPPVPPVPPKKAETGKVQPKKETVRISLPPKPTSAPTIKLPTLPAGGPPPPAAAAAPVAAAPAGRMPPATAARPPAPTAAPGARPAAPSAPVAPARPAPAPAPAAKGVSGLDIGLAIAAAVVGIGAVVSIVLLLQLK